MAEKEKTWTWRDEIDLCFVKFGNTNPMANAQFTCAIGGVVRTELGSFGIIQRIVLQPNGVVRVEFLDGISSAPTPERLKTAKTKIIFFGALDAHMEAK